MPPSSGSNDLFRLFHILPILSSPLLSNLFLVRFMNLL
jgi:hypothetical protein